MPFVETRHGERWLHSCFAQGVRADMQGNQNMGQLQEQVAWWKMRYDGIHAREGNHNLEF